MRDDHEKFPLPLFDGNGWCTLCHMDIPGKYAVRFSAHIKSQHQDLVEAGKVFAVKRGHKLVWYY